MFSYSRRAKNRRGYAHFTRWPLNAKLCYLSPVVNNSRAIFLGGLLLASPALAETVQLNPVADTTLIQASPNNNLGGKSYFNAGTTQNFTKNRGLVQFDPLASVPAGAVIQSVIVSFEVVGQPTDGYAPATFELHRMLVSWGEGNKNPSAQVGLGLPASTGEATWNSRFHNMDQPWSQPGGAAGTDFATAASAGQVVYDVGNSPYVFGSSADLVADVQYWVDHPDQNYGWMLKIADESVDFTARRFGSSESPDAAIMTIQYAMVPEPDTLWLCGAGGLWLWRRQRKSRSIAS